MAEDSIFDKITAEYYQLTTSEQKVADYIVQQGQKTQFMSISELAEESTVAESTITRFCKRLGYKGYSALKLAVANATANQHQHGEITVEDSLNAMSHKICAVHMEAITQTMHLVKPEDVKYAMQLLQKAGTVLCMGQGGSMMVAQQAAHLFSTTFPNYYAVWDSHAQVVALSHMKRDDVALVVSYSGSTVELMDMLDMVRQKNGKSILITRFPKSPGGMKADLVLQCGANEAPLQLGSVPALMAQMFLLDLLYQELCRQDFALTDKRHDELAEALMKKHL